jgi:predicted O-methyltransferase YrrM
MVERINLDTLTPVAVQVGYGDFGVRGELGYERKRVSVGGRAVANVLSTHPPARLLYRLGQRCSSFRCHVALNDDVPAGRSHAHFSVLADGRLVAHEAYVQAGDPPRPLSADVRGSELLELVVTTGQWEWSHAVWIGPELDGDSTVPKPGTLVDCLGRSEIELPARPPAARRVVATAASAGFDEMLDDLLGSIVANVRCPGTLLAAFVLGDDAKCARAAAKYRALLIPCKQRARLSPMTKALLYSVARVIDAESYICLDADMLVLDDLGPVFGAIEASPEGTIYACREGNGHGFKNLSHVLQAAYGGKDTDLQYLLGTVGGEGEYPLVVNDGIFAGGRAALLALDGAIRAMKHAPSWIDGHSRIRWRNQFVFNLALARLNCGAELDATYNVQLHVQDVEPHFETGRLRARWRGRNVRVLHFSGSGRRKYPKCKGLYASVPDPFVSPSDDDYYARFLDALRHWVARHGTGALAWSFYGTRDGRSARVVDPGVLPLFATLHYMIRSSGCTRVMESGTARGVSAACIASAVAYRTGGGVVTFDPCVMPERAELWVSLPGAMARCIEAREVDALEGMRAALRAGERYEAAFLDSLHTAEHVYQEFELARQLVCPGGLILVHDVRLQTGTVEAALQRIESAGYAVTRLWTAEGGVPADDYMGLAVIENRPRRLQVHR